MEPFPFQASLFFRWKQSWFQWLFCYHGTVECFGGAWNRQYGDIYENIWIYIGVFRFEVVDCRGIAKTSILVMLPSPSPSPLRIDHAFVSHTWIGECGTGVLGTKWIDFHTIGDEQLKCPVTSSIQREPRLTQQRTSGVLFWAAAPIVHGFDGCITTSSY